MMCFFEIHFYDETKYGNKDLNFDILKKLEQFYLLVVNNLNFLSQHTKSVPCAFLSSIHYNFNHQYQFPTIQFLTFGTSNIRTKDWSERR